MDFPGARRRRSWTLPGHQVGRDDDIRPLRRPVVALPAEITFRNGIAPAGSAGPLYAVVRRLGSAPSFCARRIIDPPCGARIERSSKGGLGENGALFEERISPSGKRDTYFRMGASISYGLF